MTERRGVTDGRWPDAHNEIINYQSSRARARARRLFLTRVRPRAIVSVPRIASRLAFALITRRGGISIRQCAVRLARSCALLALHY